MEFAVVEAAGAPGTERILMLLAPVTADLPIPRIITAACDVTPPRIVITPVAALVS